MKSKRRKIFYVALSVLIAATVWFYVNNRESVTVYVHDVPIEFLNEDTSLADKGLMRISGEEETTVDLKLQMPRNVAFYFDTSELHLVSRSFLCHLCGQAVRFLYDPAAVQCFVEQRQNRIA